MFATRFLQLRPDSCKIDKLPIDKVKPAFARKTVFAPVNRQIPVKEQTTMKKLFSAALAVSLLTTLLGGCMCQIAETEFDFDGGGIVEAKVGFSEELVDALDMRAQMAENDFTRFTYKGHRYYGDEASQRFSTVEEFNDIFSAVSSEILDSSTAASADPITLSIASDGGLTLTLACTLDERAEAMADELSEKLPDYTDEEIDALLDGLLMTYRFTFPEELTQYSEGAGISVDGCTVTVDYLSLTSGTWIFSTSSVPQPERKTLGTVTPENIPASGTAQMRRQSIEIDGKNVTLQTYALSGENGGETNYVRLRDIASLLNGTKAQFGVDWDGRVIIEPLTAYTPNGTELQAPFSGDRSYQKANAATVIYGESIPFTAIYLTDSSGNGYTYYKLRDLGKVLDFNVSWASGRGIYIETALPYMDN